MLLPEPTAEPGVHQRRVRRRDDGVVVDRALIDPAGGGEPVQVADGLGLDDGVSRAFDPDVRAPAGGPGHSKEIADDLSAGQRDGPGRSVLGGKGRDLGTGRGDVLVSWRQPGLDRPLLAVAACEQASRVVDDVIREGTDLGPGASLHVRTQRRRTRSRRA